MNSGKRRLSITGLNRNATLSTDEIPPDFHWTSRRTNRWRFSLENSADLSTSTLSDKSSVKTIFRFTGFRRPKILSIRVRKCYLKSKLRFKNFEFNHQLCRSKSNVKFSQILGVLDILLKSKNFNFYWQFA